ncbi:hypothetical protein ROJ8625_04116 [Roseivivax jejudonensis]|uniref:GIY-YIG nuclease family protein n=1 Tax=Roseivivax jejudonensis TaxID=1529041 RepID=A0A1X7ABM6_9RHOB|nr:GIY-YIG nuclease family protein [Roseivivax jejudonensis]SLN74869.1 hypothetical protein ROJ8625_04116 [Roseivivax jejudonensis]
MTGYLYAFQPDDMPMYKVGHTVSVPQRLQQLAGQTPHTMHPRIVLDCGCFWRAKAFEGHVLSWLLPWVTHGEWVSDLEAIRDAFSVVAPAVDVTDDFEPFNSERLRGRSGPFSLASLEKELLKADERSEEARSGTRYFKNPLTFEPHEAPQ